MVRLANISGKKAVRAFMRLEYKVARQTGSHVILRHEDRPTLTIPNHRELAPGLLIFENYLIFYEVDEADREIVILRILHGSRKYQDLLK